MIQQQSGIIVEISLKKPQIKCCKTELIKRLSMNKWVGSNIFLVMMMTDQIVDMLFVGNNIKPTNDILTKLVHIVKG